MEHHACPSKVLKRQPRGDTTRGCIKRIIVKTGMFVDKLEFELRSGARQVYGSGAGGIEIEIFRLASDEAIVEVTHVQTHEYLAQKFIFKTSKGRCLEMSGWGGPGKEPRKQRIVAPEGQQVCGLLFEAETKLQGICVQSQFRREFRRHPQQLMKDSIWGRQAADS